MHLKAIVSGLLICLLMLLLQGCEQPVAPDFLGCENLQVMKTEGRESLISAQVKFYNPNHFHLQLKRAEMDVFINQKLANHYLLDSTINIPALDSFYVPIQLRIDLNALLSNALQVLLSNQVNIAIDGKVKLKRGLLTTNRPFHYEGAQKLDALLKMGN